MKALTVGTSVDPSMTSWAPDAATWSAGPLYAATSSGKTALNTGWTPRFFSSTWASCTGGAADRASAPGGGAGFGRGLGGREAIHSTKGTLSAGTRTLTPRTVSAHWLHAGAETVGASPRPAPLAP